MASEGGGGRLALALGLALGSAAFVVGLALAYRAGEQVGKQATEGRSLTASDVSTFDGGQTECAPCQVPTTLYRYVSPDGNPNGKFWTPSGPDAIGEPTESLALPPSNDGSMVYTLTLRPGAVVCRGRVAPQPAWGRPGGAEQYLVLRE